MDIQFTILAIALIIASFEQPFHDHYQQLLFRLGLPSFGQF